MKDFVVGGDSKFDRKFREVSDDEDDYDESANKKGYGHKNKKAKCNEENHNTLLKYTSKLPTKVTEPSTRTKNVSVPKIDNNESKKIMDALWDLPDIEMSNPSFEVKQARPEMMFMREDDRIKQQYDMPLSALRTNMVEPLKTSQQTQPQDHVREVKEVGVSSKKRKHDDISLIQTEMKSINLSSNKETPTKPIGLSYQEEIKQSLDDYALGDVEPVGIITKLVFLSYLLDNLEEIKTESMIIEEMLMNDLQNRPKLPEISLDPPKEELANSAYEKEWKNQTQVQTQNNTQSDFSTQATQSSQKVQFEDGGN